MRTTRDWPFFIRELYKIRFPSISEIQEFSFAIYRKISRKLCSYFYLT